MNKKRRAVAGLGASQLQTLLIPPNVARAAIKKNFSPAHKSLLCVKMSMSFHEFSKLADEIMSQGYSEEEAAHFAALIGDIPVFDEAGHIIVQEHGRDLARLKPLRFFGSRRAAKAS